MASDKFEGRKDNKKGPCRHGPFSAEAPCGADFHRKSGLYQRSLQTQLLVQVVDIGATVLEVFVFHDL
ncbi:hypothetical protein, partial [Aeromonas veronii]|uniref:hypothetical protein n=1 Tax=Aeromonas veronii TaxID=654 RepID=UPI003B9E02C2